VIVMKNYFLSIFVSLFLSQYVYVCFVEVVCGV